MELVVERRAFRPTYTIGYLYVDGKRFYETLEDTERWLYDWMTTAEILKKKVKGQTAIPRGRYRVRMDVLSPKYSQKPKYKALTGGYMPRLENVKGFEGILLHGGNTDKDTEGCPLIGQNKVVGHLINSFDTFKQLYLKMIEVHKRGEEIYITIQ